ncbi:hypothetical protein [Cupriavidus sp. CuC1]|uniref:hypothetical protein n=1 Tax=Cupriavidus sp. CuC1 TaxID=3373131 RepID=UPI0037CF585F
MGILWICGIALVIALVGVAVYIGYSMALRRRDDNCNAGQSSQRAGKPIIGASPAAGGVIARAAPEEVRAVLGTELLVQDEDGNIMISTRELAAMPANAQPLAGRADVPVHSARQLAADVFKGAVGLPNKTVELVFDPKVQQGLKDGTLELIAAQKGGVYPTARQVGSKKFAGHGRVIEGGRARQMAAGAFQLLSIAVAQSHLDDINRGLDEIKQGISDLHIYLDNKDQAKLEGAVLYLGSLVSLMNDMRSPDELPLEKRGQLEAICREAMEWVVQLRLEGEALAKRILAQNDVDSLGGTENTHKALLGHADSARRLVQKRNLLLRLMALLNVCKAYVDPLNRQSLPVVSESGVDDPLKAMTGVSGSLRDRANQLLSKSLWNKQETLEVRRGEVIDNAEAMLTLAAGQQRSYDRMMNQLKDRLGRLQHDDGKIRMALSFDSNSEISAVAML